MRTIVGSCPPSSSLSPLSPAPHKLLAPYCTQSPFLQKSFQLHPQLLPPATIAPQLTDTLWGDIAVAPQAGVQTLCGGLGTRLEVVAFIAAVHSLSPHRVLLAKHNSVFGSVRETTGKSW